MNEIYLDYLIRCNDKPKYLDNLKNVFKDMYVIRHNIRSYSQTSNILSCLLYNMVKGYVLGLDGLYVSRDRSFYDTKIIYNGQIMNFKIGYVGMVKWLDFLEEIGMITCSKGFYVSEESNEAGYMLFTQKLKDTIEMYVDTRRVKLKPLENVLILRDIDGVDLPFRRTKEIKTMIDLIKSYNSFMADKNVTLYGEKLNTDLHRSFARSSFEKGGRYYNSGKSIQQLSKKDRAHVLIDGQKTLELDYCQLHPSLCYEREGVVLDEQFDCYGGDEGQMAFEVDCEYIMKRRKTDQKYNPVRNFLKKALLILINGQEERQVIFKLHQLLREDKEYPEEEQLFTGLINPDPRFAIEFLKERNYLIEKYFHSDAGIGLQRVDSDIMSAILEYCLQRSIPVLTIHDSVIVQQQYTGEIIGVMKSAFKTVVGSNFNCRIEV